MILDEQWTRRCTPTPTTAESGQVACRRGERLMTMCGGRSLPQSMTTSRPQYPLFVHEGTLENDNIHFLPCTLSTVNCRPYSQYKLCSSTLWKVLLLYVLLHSTCSHGQHDSGQVTLIVGRFSHSVFCCVWTFKRGHRPLLGVAVDSLVPGKNALQKQTKRSKRQTKRGISQS